MANEGTVNRKEMNDTSLTNNLEVTIRKAAPAWRGQQGRLSNLKHRQHRLQRKNCQERELRAKVTAKAALECTPRVHRRAASPGSNAGTVHRSHYSPATMHRTRPGCGSVRRAKGKMMTEPDIVEKPYVLKAGDEVAWTAG